MSDIKFLQEWQALPFYAHVADSTFELNEHALSFDPLIPNGTTVAAIKEARTGKLARAKTIADLKLALNADDWPDQPVQSRFCPRHSTIKLIADYAFQSWLLAINSHSFNGFFASERQRMDSTETAVFAVFCELFATSA